MNKSTVLLSTALCLMSLSVMANKTVPMTIAQQANVCKGIVKDPSGQPIIGASIRVKGSKTGSISDTSGKFTLDNIKNGDEIEISSIGFETQIIKWIGKDLDISLKDNSKGLNEIVVVGYGTQKKVNLTGSVSSIDFTQQAKSRPITNVSNALAGLSAGVQVMQNSGEPGNDGSSIRIRGIGTLNSNSPLVLVDGIEGSMDEVNPQDIESISILKDASSSAIYGSRAASGVILITTKKGQSGKLTVTYSGRFSYAQPTNLIKEVSNYADYMEWMNEATTNVGQNPYFAQSIIDTWREKSKDPNGVNENGIPNYVAYPNTDWQKVLFQHSIVQEHNISVLGGTDKLHLLMSAGYLDNPGLVDQTGIKRYSLRTNLEANLTKWLTVGTRTFATQTDKEPGDFANANNYIRQTTPGSYPKWNGKYGGPEAQGERSGSILTSLYDQDGNKKDTYFNTTLYSSITPLKGLTWDFNFNYQRVWNESQMWTLPWEEIRFSDGSVVRPSTSPSNMTTSFSNTSIYNYTLENLLKYNVLVNKVHDINILLGYQEYYYKSYTNSGSKKGLIDASIHTPSSATEMLNIDGTATDRASRSFFGRINYAFKSRYLFEANIRRDGHSRYDQKHRWGTFPSFSAGWRISEESFMENAKTWLDNLKLRISYGSLGNNGGTSVGDYESQATYSVSSYPFGGTLSSGLALSNLANPDLEWETSKMTNVGIDLNALQNRLSFTFDAFYRKTSGILFTPSIPLTVGNKVAPRQNIAEMTTKGIELTLAWNDHIGNVYYSISGNFSYAPNKVSKYKGELIQTFTDDGKGNKYWTYSNLGDVSSSASAVNPIIQGHMKNEYFLINPYKGSGKGYATDGIHGGPKDGMIRTEQDMEWVKAMITNGYNFRPNNSVAKDKLWYGDYVYADENNDGTYGGTDDRTFQGYSSDPKYTFGWQMSASWKNFDLSMDWAGQAGFKLYWSPTTGYNTPTMVEGSAIPQDIADNHYFYNPDKPDDPRTNINAKYGRLVYSGSGFQNTATSSLYLFNANYLKLKNLTFGYTFPQIWMSRIGISNLRLYMSIENVFSIDKFPGQDPELGATPAYTSVRQFAFGLNLKF